MDNEKTNRLSRLTAILTQLQTKRIVTATTLSTKFSVSIRTIYRDIRALEEAGVPIVKPSGGHAIYLDAKRFLPHISPNAFPGQALVCAIYLEGGIRSCELGGLMFPDRDNSSPQFELVRLAIPRRVYTSRHLEYVADTIINIFKNREKVRGVKIVSAPQVLRHFTAKMSEI